MSPTPLFDLEQELPPPRGSAPSVVLGIGISVLFYVFWKIDSLNVNPLLFFPAMYVFVFVHELGHAVAAWAVGWGISAMNVGGLVVHRVRGRHLLRFDTRFSLFGGYAIPSLTKDLVSRSRGAWMVAGGPIASLLLIAMMWTAVWNFGDGKWAWISTMAWVSLFGLTSLVPTTFGGLSSDAALLLLLRKPLEGRAWASQFALHSQDAEGVRPRDLDPELVQNLLAGEPEMSMHLTASYWHRDRGDNEGAVAQIEKALAASTKTNAPLYRQRCFMNASIAAALIRGNAQQARTWLDRAVQAVKGSRPENYDDALACVAMTEHRYTAALTHWRSARKKVEKAGVHAGSTVYWLEEIARQEQECQRQIDNGHLDPPQPSERPALHAPSEPASVPWIGIAALALFGVFILMAMFSD